MRLLAVLIMVLITAYWAVWALQLLFLPEGSPGATAAVIAGAGLLVFAALYALVTWGTAKRIRWLHIAAIVMAALGLMQPFSGLGWINWLIFVASLAATVLLVLTVPRSVPQG